ncbi:MAG TPA: hypothetical protein VH438_12700 [Gemmatimonadales bacterium]
MTTRTRGFENAKAAHDAINYAANLYQNRFGKRRSKPRPRPKR